MNTTNTESSIQSKFDNIAPLYDHEVEETIRELVNDEGFIHAVKYILPNIDWNDFSAGMLKYQTKYDFQSQMISPFVWAIAKKTSSSINSEGFENISNDKQHLFLSNHRDIILDAGLLNIMLHNKGMQTTEIGIGDNLLIYPWIKKLVRLNKSFLVQRGVSMKQMLEVSTHLSEYIHYVILEKGESVWLAQREGRAKDSNDRTQSALLKMLTLSPKNISFIESLQELNIIPLSISYEYDPCDFLKAQEFQLKRDNPDHKKTQRDDLINMETGLLGFKGNINFRFGNPINDELEKLKGIEKKLQVEAAGKCIDREIHLNYTIFPCNYIAYDMLNGSEQFKDYYTSQEIEKFREYLHTQINKIKIPNKDFDFLWEKMLVMYSNTLKNHMAAKNEIN